MAKKVLYVATVVKTHIMQFHTPFLKMCKELGWETAVAARNDYADPADCNIPFCDAYFDVPFRRNPLGKENLAAYRQLKKIIENGDYDIIHCHTPMGGVLTRLAARKARKRGTKVIYTAHGFHFFKGAPILNWLVYYPVEWLLAHLTDVLITINREDDVLARKHMHAKEVLYIPGVGVDTDRLSCGPEQANKLREMLAIPEDAQVILSVGEVNKNKNHQAVIHGLARMKQKKVYYVVCGSGPLAGQLQELAKSLSIEDRVIFVGYHRGVAKYYAIADMFVFPSLREGLPISLMEAMACNVPVVCSRVRGNTDLIEDGVSGRVVSQDIDAYAQAMEDVLTDSAKRTQYVANAQMSLDKFKVESVVLEMKKCYLSTVEETVAGL